VTLVIAGALSAAFAAAQARGGQGGNQQAPAATAIQVEKVRNNLYVLSGGGGNTAAVVTAHGVVLVDTKLPGWGRPILQSLKEITDKPVTAIINTHTHFDHVSGNVEAPATVEIVAHENAARQMREMRQPTGVSNAPQEAVAASSTLRIHGPFLGGTSKAVTRNHRLAQADRVRRACG
jgi:glyoxylase-like metal-dependent hydrolase (beta-lactamase superfamily II)